MVDNKYNKILTAILIIIVIAILIVLGFWGYDFFQRYYLNSGANEVIGDFDEQLAQLNNMPEEVQSTTEEPTQTNETPDSTNQTKSTTTKPSGGVSGSGTTKKRTVSVKYKGYDVAGKIEIPAIKLSYPVLTVATESSMKVSVGILYGVGLNQVGNTLIMGHNYRNGALFSNNDKLKNGNEIYITDTTGLRLKYIIYNKYYTSSTDFEFATRDTAGKREITLESCTDDSKSRVIIWAKEE